MPHNNGARHATTADNARQQWTAHNNNAQRTVTVRVGRVLSLESDLVTHSTSPRAQRRLTLALSVSNTCDGHANTTNSCSPHLHPRLPSSSLSLPTTYKFPLASNPADISPAPWCAPQVCAAIAPVSCMSCMSSLTPCPPFLACGHVLHWTFSCKRTYMLLLRMFLLSFFILDLSLLSLASPHFPLPSVPNSHRSFRLRACCRALTPHTFAAFYLNARLPSHTTPRARRWQDSLFGFDSRFLFPLSLHSIQCIAMNSDSINTQALPC